MSSLAAPGRMVFLFDVDNTLLDNDRVTADLSRFLEQTVGKERQQRYWTIFETLRGELGYADYLGALQRYRLEDQGDPHLLRISSYLVDYPFANRLFPGSLDVLERTGQRGTTVILSDGDVVFQPRKIERSGLLAAVEGRVLIYVHKDEQITDIERRYPADHYVVVDDKVWLLAAFKKVWADRVTTVFPRQGHYARESRVSSYPAPDVTVERINEFAADSLV
jgi:FMN phosphatase YigB (HAD superfamily)